jgi:predicted nucleotidyltransferase
MHDLEKYKDLIIPVLNRYSIKRASIFGSLAKGKLDVESDIDLLIEPGKGFAIFEMLKLEDEISELTHRKIDLVEFSAIKLSIKEEVLSSAISIL